MESYRLPKFNFNFDGNMTLARYIVNIYKASDNFTLLNYPGKENFYINSLTTYDEYITILSGDALEYKVDIPNDTLKILDNIRTALERMPNLTYEHLLRAYIEIMKYFDLIKGFRAIAVIYLLFNSFIFPV